MLDGVYQQLDQKVTSHSIRCKKRNAREEDYRDLRWETSGWVTQSYQFSPSIHTTSMTAYAQNVSIGCSVSLQMYVDGTIEKTQSVSGHSCNGVSKTKLVTFVTLFYYLFSDGIAHNQSIGKSNIWRDTQEQVIKFEILISLHFVWSKTLRIQKEHIIDDNFNNSVINNPNHPCRCTASALWSNVSRHQMTLMFLIRADQWFASSQSLTNASDGVAQRSDCSQRAGVVMLAVQSTFIKRQYACQMNACYQSL